MLQTDADGVDHPLPQARHHSVTQAVPGTTNNHHSVTQAVPSGTVNGGGSKRWTFSETMDIRDFTVCIIRCVYRAELILGT